MGRKKGVVLNGERLRRLREERGWTQQELSDEARYDAKGVSRAECGTAISLRQAASFAAALGVGLAELLEVTAEELQDRIESHGFAPPAPPAAFVGRGKEQRAIEAWLSDTDAPKCLVISGLSGIGKSTLLSRILDSQRERFKGRIIWVTCYSKGIAVRTTAAIEAVSDALQFSEQLPDALGPGAGGRTAAFRKQLWASCDIVVLDELADLELLQSFRPPLGFPQAKLIITSLRQVADVIRRFCGQDALEIPLSPLSREGLRHLVTRLVGPQEASSLSDNHWSRLLRSTAGLPRNIVNLCRLRDQADPWRSNSPNTAAPPLTEAGAPSPVDGLSEDFWRSSDELVSDRFGLSGRARNAMAYISPLGRAAFSADWAAIFVRSSVAEARGLLKELVSAGVLRWVGGSDGTRLAMFEPDALVVAQAVATELAVSVPLELARALVERARSLDEEGSLQRLAEEVSAWSMALEFFLGENALPNAARYARPVVETVARLCPELERGRLRAGERWICRARELVVKADGSQGGEGARWLTRLWLAQGRLQLSVHLAFSEAIVCFEHAITLGERGGCGDLAADAAAERGRSLAALNRPEAAVESYRRAVSLSRLRHHGPHLAQTLNNTAVTFTRQSPENGRWKPSLALLDEALALIEGFGDPLLAAVVQTNRAVVLSVLGDDSALAVLEAARDRWRQSGWLGVLTSARFSMLASHIRGVDDLSEASDGWAEAVIGSAAHPSDIIWQAGEAAFYVRLFLQTRNSPIVAGGFAISDVTRDGMEGRSFSGPLGVLTPVAVWVPAHRDPVYRTAVRAQSDALFGAANRISRELDGLALFLD